MNPWGSIWSWYKDDEAMAGFDPNVDYYSEDFPQGELTITSGDGTVTYQGNPKEYEPNNFAENFTESFNETINGMTDSVNKTKYAIIAIGIYAIYRTFFLDQYGYPRKSSIF